MVAGPDGYCVIVPTSPDPKLEETVHLNGHVGDVLDAKWFPSGEVGIDPSRSQPRVNAELMGS